MRPPLTISHPPTCPDCGAAFAATVYPGVDTIGSGASGIAHIDVRSANPWARYRVVTLPGLVATYPARCGCGVRWALVVSDTGLRLELGDDVE